MASPSQVVNKSLSELSEKLLASKRTKGLTWDSIASQVGLSPVFVASVCLGQNSIPREAGLKLLQVLEIENAEDNATLLSQPPLKGQHTQALTQDPFLARLNEMTTVYGLAIKEVVQEQFGDGIMSAIDFTAAVEKVPDPKGDRVKLTLTGKFLPFKAW